MVRIEFDEGLKKSAIVGNRLTMEAGDVVMDSQYPSFVSEKKKSL